MKLFRRSPYRSPRLHGRACAAIRRATELSAAVWPALRGLQRLAAADSATAAVLRGTAASRERRPVAPLAQAPMRSGDAGRTPGATAGQRRLRQAAAPAATIATCLQAGREPIHSAADVRRAERRLSSPTSRVTLRRCAWRQRVARYHRRRARSSTRMCRPAAIDAGPCRIEGQSQSRDVNDRFWRPRCSQDFYWASGS